MDEPISLDEPKRETAFRGVHLSHVRFRHIDADDLAYVQVPQQADKRTPPDDRQQKADATDCDCQ